MEESRGKKWEGLRLCGRSNLSKQISVRHGADEDPFCRMMRKVRMMLVTYVGSMAVTLYGQSSITSGRAVAFLAPS
jgi:hypothetical protein